MSPARRPAPANEYELIKMQIERKQSELINSQYSLNPANQRDQSADCYEPASSKNITVRDAPSLYKHNTANDSSRQNLLAALNQAV